MINGGNQQQRGLESGGAIKSEEVSNKKSSSLVLVLDLFPLSVLDLFPLSFHFGFIVSDPIFRLPRFIQLDFGFIYLERKLRLLSWDCKCFVYFLSLLLTVDSYTNNHLNVTHHFHWLGSFLNWCWPLSCLWDLNVNFYSVV